MINNHEIVIMQLLHKCGTGILTLTKRLKLSDVRWENSL